MMGEGIAGDSDHDSDVDIAIQEAVEEQQRKQQEAKKDEGKLGMSDMEMRMGGLRMGGGKGQPPRSMMPKVRRGTKACNTGPKGVKADYEEAKLIMQFKHLREAMRAERELKKKALGKTDFSEVARNAEKGNEKREDEDEDEDEDDEDDEIFQKYKQQTLDLIKNSLPTYGRFYRVMRESFISETESEHELVHVVVHLYENHIPACIRLNLILEDIAPQFSHVKFIRCRSKDLVDSFSAIALPMLLVYRGGKVIHTLPQVSKHFPRKWEDKDVVKFLAQKGILNEAIYKVPARTQKQKRLEKEY
eukprot:CAMPEP_0184481386 /NCGR_PEP_ID=MMETSP0113_2-20130426/2936_1 /TAXON_ID=91329 /ORGANISM="Norrisiella sphaerica, Strain BC52" /LENGTH=303 /DNA_ID=CAMNT_0026860489 /DNA_START=31 /DNA_END=942 /DNA_ORIENTATION=-